MTDNPRFHIEGVNINVCQPVFIYGGKRPSKRDILLWGEI